LVAGTVVALTAKSAYDDAKTAFDACPDTACEGANLPRERSAINRANLATGLIIGGAAVAGLGVTLVVVGGSKGDSRTASISLQIRPSGVSFAGRF
jgi:hypothetical protein